MTSLSFVGTGNLAACLGGALREKGFIINHVYGRNPERAQILAQALGCKRAQSLEEMAGSADILILAVKDDALPEVSQQIQTKSLVIHCSGSSPMAMLKEHAAFGVMYPVQTFTRDSSPDFSQIPLCIEANDPAGLQLLRNIAAALSRHVYELDSPNRKVLHLAAVIANNFTNHLFAQAAGLLAGAGIPFSVLHALMQETVRKAIESDPRSVQTGPAVRGDQVIMQEHLHMLEKNPQLQSIYKLLSEAIVTR
jgi:predicted short-subunit dehydrogenase-like oxidoreductase (DUF2520 family)